jgi:PPOX class probable F420-dependent enzyme
VAAPDYFEALNGHRYMRLSTFRRSGEAVHTPVWFARVGDSLYVVTGRNTGKAKRIRNNPGVLLTPSNFRGRPRGPELRATSRQTDQQRGDPADRALGEKYGWQYRAFLRVEGLIGSPEEMVFLEFRRPAGEG